MARSSLLLVLRAALGALCLAVVAADDAAQFKLRDEVFAVANTVRPPLLARRERLW